MFFKKTSSLEVEETDTRSGKDAIWMITSILFTFLLGGFVFWKSMNAGIQYLTTLVPLLLVIAFSGTYFYNKSADMRMFSAFTGLAAIGIALQVIIDEQYQVISQFSMVKYFAGLAIAIVLILMYRMIRKALNFNYTTYFLLFVAACLYIALLFFGKDTNGYGTTAWIKIGPVSLQLTDFAKITAILFYSSLFSARKTYSNRSILILSSVFFIINFIGSVLIHELGSFYILYFLHLSMLYIFMEKGRKKRIYLLTIAIATISAIVILFLLYKILAPSAAAGTLNGLTRILWPIVRKVYLRFSITANINSDPYGAGFQLFQGKRALWMSGLFGNTVNFTAIPVPESDMAFVTLVNSFGMPLGFIVVFLLLQIGIRGSELSRRLILTDKQDAVVAYGATVLLFMQAMLVILGSCNIIPLAGLPIPFLSRGGTYQAIVFFFAGILLQMSERHDEFDDEDLEQGGDENNDDQAFTRIDINE